MKKDKYLIAIICLICIFVFFAISITGNIFTLNDLPLNFMAAFLGAIINAVITLILLNGQSRAEEFKDKNVKVFEKKSQLFENFNSKLQNVVINQTITANDYIEIKSEYYSRLMMYLNTNSQNKIISCLANLGNCVGISFDAGIYSLNKINIAMNI